VWSNLRGLLTGQSPANAPAIGDSGEVCFVRSDPERLELHTDRRGVIVDLGETAGTTCDINSQGEVVYRGLDEDGHHQIFSTARHQLTDEPETLLGSPSVNNRGEVVWVQGGELHSLSEGQITEFGGKVGFRLDVNDLGDIVFSYWHRKTYLIALATLDPERYPEFRPLKYESVREPDFEVEIRIDPLGNPGVVVLGSRDLLPVAILTTQVSSGESVDFDALQVAPLSVRFGPGRAGIVVRSMASREDIDEDGDTDLLLFFRPDKPRFGCGDTEAVLVGRTRDGTAFQGLTPVQISGCE
jgi:hypothetical protein